MKKIILISTAILIATSLGFGQGTAINTTGSPADNSAVLDVSSSTKGFLCPRMSKAEKLAISVPANGLLIYQTDDTTGFWFFNSVKWMPVTGTTACVVPSGNNTGDMLYWNGSSWVVLPIGNNGQALVINSGVPVWSNVAPTVVTTAVTGITAYGASGGGDITPGMFNVTARGVCYGTGPSPTIAGNHTNDGSGSGSFTSTLSGLSVGVTCYVRAYATCAIGTFYGNEVSFTTFTPLSIGGCIAWFDADDTATFTLSGTSISEWRDKSASLKHLSGPATLSQDPIWVTSAYNGRAAVRFNSSSYQYLSNATFAFNLANRSVFVVVKTSNPLQNYGRIMSVNAVSPGLDWNSNSGYTMNIDTPDNLTVINNSAIYSISYLQTNPMSAPALFENLATGGSGGLWRNGVYVSQSSNPGATTSGGGYSLGTRHGFFDQYFSGDILEVLIYDNEISAANRQNIENYLDLKWNLW